MTRPDEQLRPVSVSGERRAIALCSYVPALVPRSGEQIRVNAMLRALAALGAPVYAFVPGEGDLTLSFGGRSSIIVRRSGLSWPQLSRNPWDYWRVNQSSLAAVAALCRQQPVRAVILDYGFLGQYVAPIRRLGVPVVIDTHNAQSEITRQVPPRSLAHRGVIAMTHSLERWHERRFFPDADAVLCVSSEDRDYHARFIDPGKLHVVPNFIETPAVPAFVPLTKRIIMTGSFTNFQNFEGARWFLEHVWSPELAKQASFCLAGRGSEEALARLGQFPNVSALGERADMLVEIAGSMCAVAPILHASGTRLKCIEALSLRTPIVSTTRGAEGLRHNGAVAVADTPEGFRREILRMIKDELYRKHRAALGHALFLREYSLDANVERLDRVLSTLKAPRWR